MKEIEPIAKPFLSLCMIVKNEKENLARCLASVKPYVDEMIVVDTGSADGTPEIALNHGAKVSYFEWCDDFAAARNYSIAQASGDWILVLDADEELIIETDNWKHQLAANSEVTIYGMVLLHANIKNLKGGFHGRLFRNLPGVRYIGRFHEQIDYPNTKIVISQLEGVKILHYGNISPDKVKQKLINRDIPILEQMREEKGFSLWHLDCLARKYTRIEQTEKAEECYAEILDKLSPHLMDGNPPEDLFWIATLLHMLGTQYFENKDYETARLLCQRGLEWRPNYPPLNHLAGEILKDLGFPLGAIAYFENCLKLGQNEAYYTGEPFEISFLTTYPAYNIGCIYLEMKRPQDALVAFEMALAFDPGFAPAQERINEIKPSFATDA